MINRALSTTYAVIRAKKSLHNTCYATQIGFKSTIEDSPRMATGQRSPLPLQASRPPRPAPRPAGVIRFYSDNFLKDSPGFIPGQLRPEKFCQGDTPFSSVLLPAIGTFCGEIYQKNKRGKKSIDSQPNHLQEGRKEGEKARSGWEKGGGQTKCSAGRAGRKTNDRVPGGIPGGKRKMAFPRENEGLRARLWDELMGMRGLGRGKNGDLGGRAPFSGGVLGI